MFPCQDSTFSLEFVLMNDQKTRFKFSRVDALGAPISTSGLLGSVGFAEKFTGETTDDDSVIGTLRLALYETSFSQEPLSEQQTDVLRSFAAAWLINRNRKLGPAVAYAVELKESIGFLSQVGFLDRTALTARNVATGIASMAFAWELMQYCEVEPFSAMVANEIAIAVLPAAFWSEVENRFGQPGSPVRRSDFDSNHILVFLQHCHMRMAIERVDADKALIESLFAALDHRIFSLFMLNSRQLEGLVCSGASEASAAVAAHAAIALGLAHVRCKETIFENLESQIASLDDKPRKEESIATLTAIRKHLKLNTTAIERQLNRQLLSASSSEALDLVVHPVQVSLQLMSLVAGGMESIVPGQYSKAFGILKYGCDSARTAATSTPDAFASALDSGITAESWTRQQFEKVFSVFKTEQNPSASADSD